MDYFDPGYFDPAAFDASLLVPGGPLGPSANPYFDCTYFDQTYFDSPGCAPATTGGRHAVRLIAPSRPDDDELWTLFTD